MQRLKINRSAFLGSVVTRIVLWGSENHENRCEALQFLSLTFSDPALKYEEFYALLK